MRRGRKAAGLQDAETAELPKDDAFGMPGFFYLAVKSKDLRRGLEAQWKMNRPGHDPETETVPGLGPEPPA